MGIAGVYLRSVGAPNTLPDDVFAGADSRGAEARCGDDPATDNMNDNAWPASTFISCMPFLVDNVPHSKGKITMQGAEKIVSTAYDAGTERLVVTFDSGRSFVFDNVPAINAELLAIESDPATYFEGWIRKHFTWTELKTSSSISYSDSASLDATSYKGTQPA